MRGEAKCNSDSEEPVQWNIISRIISPEMPAVVTVQPITSRSWHSSAGDDLTVPASELQRVRAPRTFERIVATWPSRGRLRPV